MKIGTRSLLYGVHAMYLHPWFVAYAWWKLYGFPWAPWLWVAFFTHDLGYWGKPDMDGPEGETHPWLGARILYDLQGAWLFLQQDVLHKQTWPRSTIPPVRWWNVRRRYAGAVLSVARGRIIWGNEALFHSRYMAQRYGVRPSRLCMADKLSIALVPAWLYLPMARATGELEEYMAASRGRRNEGAGTPAERLALVHTDPRIWFAGLQSYLRRYAYAHRDRLTDDTWTSQLFDVDDHAAGA